MYDWAITAPCTTRTSTSHHAFVTSEQERDPPDLPAAVDSQQLVLLGQTGIQPQESCGDTYNNVSCRHLPASPAWRDGACVNQHAASSPVHLTPETFWGSQEDAGIFPHNWRMRSSNFIGDLQANKAWTGRPENLRPCAPSPRRRRTKLTQSPAAFRRNSLGFLFFFLFPSWDLGP